MDSNVELRSRGLATEFLYCYDKLFVQGRLTEGKYLELPNGLFRRDISVRNEKNQQKHHDRMATGYKYKWPIKLN